MKHAPKVIGCGLALLLSAGCSSGSTDTGTGTADVTSSVPAGNCEVFVDRAAPHFDSHGVEALSLFLKTPLGKLDSRGGVKEVGYHARQIADGKEGAFQDIVATRFANAPDYWQLRFDMANDFIPTAKFVGAFYVEAVDGTRLWLNASEGGPNFVLDVAMIGNLSKLRPAGFFASSSTDSPSSGIAVAAEFPYLNAKGCR